MGTLDNKSSSSAARRPYSRNSSGIEISPAATEDEVLYALPAQKGGGSVNVRTLHDESRKAVTSSSKESSEAGIVGKISTGPEISTSAAQSDDEVMYALPLRKGGGSMTVKTLDASFKESSLSRL